MLSMLACGMETDSVSSVLSTFQSQGIGTSLTYNGLTVTFAETVANSLSFKIERE